jgi:hypothetical protein
MRMARISYCVPALGLLTLVAACSDPVPPASQGAVAVTFANQALPPAGARCPVPHSSSAPILTTGNVRTTATVKGSLAIDGENGSLVSCTVAPGGAGYSVSATIHADVNDSQGHRWADFTISIPSISDGQSDASGTLTAMDNITDLIAYSSPSTDPCKFSVTGSSLGIGPGKIWGGFTCPTLLDSANAGGDACKVTGNFVFENCAQ